MLEQYCVCLFRIHMSKMSQVDLDEMPPEATEIPFIFQSKAFLQTYGSLFSARIWSAARST